MEKVAEYFYYNHDTIKGGEFGYNRSHWSDMPEGYVYHTGIDLSGDSSIKNCFHGTVRRVEMNHVYYGNFVETIFNLKYYGDFQDQLVYIRYKHLEKINPSVSVGFLINVGDPIGRMGNTGKSKGKHLHLEVVQRNVKHGRRTVLMENIISVLGIPESGLNEVFVWQWGNVYINPLTLINYVKRVTKK